MTKILKLPTRRQNPLALCFTNWTDGSFPSPWHLNNKLKVVKITSAKQLDRGRFTILVLVKAEIFSFLNCGNNASQSKSIKVTKQASWPKIVKTLTVVGTYGWLHWMLLHHLRLLPALWRTEIRTHSAKQGQIFARAQKMPTLSVSLSPLSAKHSAARGAVRGGCTDLLFSNSLGGFPVFPGSVVWGFQCPSLEKERL